MKSAALVNKLFMKLISSSKPTFETPGILAGRGSRRLARVWLYQKLGGSSRRA